jgi:hypothetical protein
METFALAGTPECHRAERVAGRNDIKRLGAAVPGYAGLRRKIVGAGYRDGPCVPGSARCCSIYKAEVASRVCAHVHAVT